MNNLQEATERICELKGSLVALDALLPALMDAVPHAAQARMRDAFEQHAEAARTVLLHADISDVVLATFERDVARNRALLCDAPSRSVPAGALDLLLLHTTRITACAGERRLGSASGFFFRRGERCFLVGSREVFADAVDGQWPDRLEIVLHTDAQRLAQVAVLSLPLQHAGSACWRQAEGLAVLEMAPERLPAGALMQAFGPADLVDEDPPVALGDPLSLLAYPQEWFDSEHHLPVACRASLASAFGVRHRRQDCFLVDAAMLPGCGGAPVLRLRATAAGDTATSRWQLLGVLAGPVAMADARPAGLQRAWHAAQLLALTQG